MTDTVGGSFCPCPLGVPFQATMMKEHKMAMELGALDEAGRADLTRRVSEMQASCYF